MTPLATFTAVRYSAVRALVGAARMATQQPHLRRAAGLRFAKLLGSGVGFGAVPEPRVWALLASWSDAADWERFRDRSPVMAAYRGEREAYTLLLDPLGAHGRWSGRAPFGDLPVRRADPQEPVVVLTRAAIRPARTLRFWERVPHVQDTLRGHPDLLVAFGVGEAPWFRQGTVSAWRTAAAMQAWAYGNDVHAEVVRRTRDEAWYGEELFARFRLVGTEGTWGGSDPLAGVAASSPR